VISIGEVKRRFGTSTPKRQFLFERFQAVFNLLHETGKVKHVYLFGSFPAAIPSPNDVDLFVVMAADFTTRDYGRTSRTFLPITPVECGIIPMSFG